MANYSTLKAAVADVVKTNGTQAITGANLQSVLLSIINSVGGGGYIFKGVATPSTSAGTPDENVFYIGGAGTYANFGTSVTVPVGSICVFKYNGSWTKEQIALFVGIDDVPTANSNNLVKSGGVYNAITDINIEIGEPVKILTSTFPKSSYYNFTFNTTKVGKYYIIFSGTEITGNININKNDGGTVSVVVRDFNPSANGNECHFEITATNLIQILVFFPATLASSLNGDITASLYEEGNIRREISNISTDVEEIQEKLPNNVVLENLIVGDFSKTTPFIFSRGKIIPQRERLQDKRQRSFRS